MKCPRHPLCHRLAAAFLITITSTAVAADIPDFCFLQISDVHITPLPAGAPDPGPNDRSVAALAWFCAEAQKPQTVPALNVTTPKPAFAVATGDVTEFGGLRKTWDTVERYLKPLGIPLYVTPGNHDNTWTNIQQIMRERYGSDNYSFDKFGCHFVGINTATPQEPLPNFEQRTLTFLAEDLKKVPADRPVFLFCHHPVAGTEYAEPYEQLRFLETLRGKNVVLLLMGHGHGVITQRWDVLDSAEGGSTFGPNTGYNIIAVQKGVLHVAYRYQDATKPMKVLLSKPLAPKPTPTAELNVPRAGAIISADSLPVQMEVTGARPARVTASVDGGPVVPLKGAGNKFTGQVPLTGLTPGAHFVRVIADCGKGLQLDRANAFVYSPAAAPRREAVTLAAGIKATPIMAGNEIIVATTAGEVIAVQTSPVRKRVILKTGGEILHAPAMMDKVLYVGSGDTNVYAVGLDGQRLWKCPVKASVCGTPAVDANSVYVGDIEGFVHAIDRATGALRWSKPIARFTIEMPLVLHQGTLYFGAWDSSVYAVNAADGSVKWKQYGPAGQTEERRYKATYYAPADAAPVIIGKRLFVADRAYFLGSYSLEDGKYLGQIATNVAAISASANGKQLLVRGMKELACHDGEGKKLWATEMRLDRFPVGPTPAGDKIYACTNNGLLSAVNAADGKVLASYQVTPQLHVMAPVALDPAGKPVVAGMDGTVTRVGM